MSGVVTAFSNGLTSTARIPQLIVEVNQLQQQLQNLRQQASASGGGNNPALAQQEAKISAELKNKQQQLSEEKQKEAANYKLVAQRTESTFGNVFNG